MPVYEFHCPRCNLLLEFFARRPSSVVPACPHCGGPLSREVTAFSTGSSGGADEAEALGGSHFDDARVERAVEALGPSLDAIGDDADPRAAARAVRDFSEASGLSLNREVRGMLSRIEQGADPDAVAEEFEAMTDAGEEPFADAGAASRGAGAAPPPADAVRPAPPRRDPKLYDLPSPPLPERKPSPWS